VPRDYSVDDSFKIRWVSEAVENTTGQGGPREPATHNAGSWPVSRHLLSGCTTNGRRQARSLLDGQGALERQTGALCKTLAAYDPDLIMLEVHESLQFPRPLRMTGHTSDAQGNAQTPPSSQYRTVVRAQAVETGKLSAGRLDPLSASRRAHSQ
jgi:hypothetical protein